MTKKINMVIIESIKPAIEAPLDRLPYLLTTSPPIARPNATIPNIKEKIFTSGIQDPIMAIIPTIMEAIPKPFPPFFVCNGSWLTYGTSF